MTCLFVDDKWISPTAGFFKLQMAYIIRRIASIPRSHKTRLGPKHKELDGTRYSTHLCHATLQMAQCRYRRAADTSTKVFPHCGVTGFRNFTFTFLFRSIVYIYWTIYSSTLTLTVQSLINTSLVQSLPFIFSCAFPKIEVRPTALLRYHATRAGQ